MSSSFTRSYMNWLFVRRDKEGYIGDLARFAFATAAWNGTQNSLQALCQGTDHMRAYLESLRAFRADNLKEHGPRKVRGPGGPTAGKTYYVGLEPDPEVLLV